MLTPLCLSISLAAGSSNDAFAGKRPAGASPVGCAETASPEVLVNATSEGLPPYILDLGQVSTVVPTLHASMFNPPTPCDNTLLATVPSKGFLARIIGSIAGLSAVPQPSHCLAASVAGAVTAPPSPCPPTPDGPVCNPLLYFPTASRSTSETFSAYTPNSGHSLTMSLKASTDGGLIPAGLPSN